MEYPKFSVLMSIYIKEKAEYFVECMESIEKQTVQPNEIVIVEDGPLTDELYKVIESYQIKYPSLIKVVKLEKNVGLGLALREGVLHCSNEIIARMDTDDIARDDRFECQLREFINSPSLDICGSHILEFDGNLNNILSKRIVPVNHDEIVKYQKQRSAFNHMTVMYKKTAVLNAGNYENCPLMEDDMLWVKMIMSGARCFNVNDYLVYARTGYGMIARRGGLSYFKKYKNARKKIYKTGYISFYDYHKTLIVQLVVSLMPKRVRMFVFTNFLR